MRKILLCLLLCTCKLLSAQTADSVFTASARFQEKYSDAVENKLRSVNNSISKKTDQYLSVIAKHELKLMKKLAKFDSSAYHSLKNAQNKYDEFSAQIKSRTEKVNQFFSGEYLPNLDSLESSLSFLKNVRDVTGRTAAVKKKLDSAISQLNQLKGKLQQAEELKQYLKERKQQIKALLAKHTKLPRGVSRELSRLNKDVYYYSQQLREIKAIINEPGRLEQQLLAALNRVPAFSRFMQQNSMLAAMFPMPSSYGTPQALRGLQTAAQVQQLMQGQVQAGGPNAQQLIQQQVQQAQNQLSRLKDKINQLGGGNSSVEIPDFRANSQKTRSLKQRLEFGANLQTSKSNNLLPVTSDLAVTVGYKLDDNRIIGISAAYKMGLGKGWNHISITHQGLGFRSFIDWRIKGGIFLSGGYEMNYLAQFRRIQDLKFLDAWQQSCLIGAAKKYSIGKKRQGDVRLLFDFFYSRHVPRTQPVLFRIGYSF
jgi:hypothetical protein